jgi:hypothetical protein
MVAIISAGTVQALPAVDADILIFDPKLRRPHFYLFRRGTVALPGRNGLIGTFQSSVHDPSELLGLDRLIHVLKNSKTE